METNVQQTNETLELRSNNLYRTGALVQLTEGEEIRPVQNWRRSVRSRIFTIPYGRTTGWTYWLGNITANV